jgi:hypothetical protein
MDLFAPHLRRGALALLLALLAWFVPAAQAQTTEAPERAVDIPTRPGVTQRLLLLQVPQAKAVVVLFAGGDGGLRLTPEGDIGALRNNFLVRARRLFAAQGLSVALIDAPSDRQSSPYLGGWRQTPAHVEDVRLTMAWLRQNLGLPVWLIGTSRGTQSVAHVATRLAESGNKADNADGIVLTSTILSDRNSRPVPAMPLDKLNLPVLVVHHEQDGCRLCSFSGIPALMGQLSNAARKDLQTWRGGLDRGDPCEAMAHHGFNGLEKDVVAGIAAWIRQ